MKDIISIDVEDWFHILELESTPNLHEWENLESRIENNFLNMLDILEEKNVKATCFFLGWIAEKYPQLVREASKRKHEIASHGYAHQLIYTQTEKQFYEDISKTKHILENISGTEVIGYRAPGFSIIPETTWAFAQLAKAGYKYDSSLFPAKRGHGYFLETKLYPFKIVDFDFYEFPITVAHFLSKNICFFGGGYLRLFPYWLIKIMTKQVANENRPVIYYIHPREIDINQPRLDMNLKRQFKSYINLKTTKVKLRKIIANNEYISFAGCLREYEEYFGETSKNVALTSVST
jgi:polysaccharide deacetylase family protein (PEP-CTERM system associated)